MKKKKKVIELLVIDDNYDQWCIMEFMIRRTLPDACCRHLPDEKEVRKMIKKAISYDKAYRPDLIILDLYLPDQPQGLRVLQEIRQPANPWHAVPVIMLSSSSHDADIILSNQNGCSSYLVKPCDANQWTDFFVLIKKFWFDIALRPLNGNGHLSLF